LLILGTAVAERTAQGAAPAAAGVADLGRHRVNRVRIDAGGEYVPVAIDDLGPLGRRLDGAQLLPVGLGGSSSWRTTCR
jgi:hypothetical protein